MEAIGRKRWAIAEGDIPGKSTGPAPAMESHEACCILNTGDAAASVRLTLYYEDSRQAENALMTTMAFACD